MFRQIMEVWTISTGYTLFYCPSVLHFTGQDCSASVLSLELSCSCCEAGLMCGDASSASSDFTMQPGWNLLSLQFKILFLWWMESLFRHLHNNLSYAVYGDIVLFSWVWGKSRQSKNENSDPFFLHWLPRNSVTLQAWGLILFISTYPIDLALWLPPLSVPREPKDRGTQKL